jgi:hypothetical protein
VSEQERRGGWKKEENKVGSKTGVCEMQNNREFCVISVERVIQEMARRNGGGEARNDTRFFSRVV